MHTLLGVTSLNYQHTTGFFPHSEKQIKYFLSCFTKNLMREQSAVTRWAMTLLPCAFLRSWKCIHTCLTWLPWSCSHWNGNHLCAAEELLHHLSPESCNPSMVKYRFHTLTMPIAIQKPTKDASQMKKKENPRQVKKHVQKRLEATALPRRGFAARIIFVQNVF